MKRSLITLTVAASFLAACTSSQWTRTPVVKQHEFNVTLEQRQDNAQLDSQRYAHPQRIELVVLKKLLAALTYMEEAGLLNKEKNNPVFQAEEIERLAPVLADALAKADASQRIRFISFNHGKAMIFSVSRKTEGVMFIEGDGQLNIAFNFINLDRQANETTAMFPKYSNTEPLKIKSSDTPISSMAPYVRLQRFENGKQAPMWVVVDLEKLKAASTNVSVSTTKAAEKEFSIVAPETEAIKAPTEKPEAMGPSVEKTALPSASGDAFKEELKADIKNKLKYLKELLDEGLISEKTYNVKEMELLNKIN